jgi:hypothetical protein
MCPLALCLLEAVSLQFLMKTLDQLLFPYPTTKYLNFKLVGNLSSPCMLPIVQFPGTIRRSVRHNAGGVQYLFDLGACFELPKDPIIQAFDVVQAADRTLYVAYAYLRDAASSHVVLAKPFPPRLSKKKRRWLRFQVILR